MKDILIWKTHPLKPFLDFPASEVFVVEEVFDEVSIPELLPPPTFSPDSESTKQYDFIDISFEFSELI